MYRSSIGACSLLFVVLQASTFTSRQFWLSRQEEALNPHTLYSSYALEPTSPPPAPCLTLFSATHLENSSRRASEQHSLLLFFLLLLLLLLHLLLILLLLFLLPPVLDVKPSRKLITLFASCILTISSRGVCAIKTAASASSAVSGATGAKWGNRWKPEINPGISGHRSEDGEWKSLKCERACRIYKQAAEQRWKSLAPSWSSLKRRRSWTWHVSSLTPERAALTPPKWTHFKNATFN